MAANEKQIGGDHYKTMVVQVWDVIDQWPLEQQIGYYRGNALKYTMRMGTKGDSAEEIGKAKHYSEKLLEVLAKAQAAKFEDKERPSSGIYPDDPKTDNTKAIQDAINDALATGRGFVNLSHVPVSEVYADDTQYSAEDLQAASLVHDAEMPSISQVLKECKEFSTAIGKAWTDLEPSAREYEKKRKEEKQAELRSNTTIHADPDGWIEHHGDECPLSDGDISVDVKGFDKRRNFGFSY
jgi:hypothetical protein